MPRWIRVFGTNQQTPRASEIQTSLLRCGMFVQSDVDGDDGSWEQVRLRHELASESVQLELLPPDDPELADEIEPILDWLSEQPGSPNAQVLRETLSRVSQVYIIGVPDSAQLGTPNGQMTILLARLLSRWSDGLYQVDNEGFYDRHGTLLQRDR